MRTCAADRDASPEGSVHVPPARSFGEPPRQLTAAQVLRSVDSTMFMRSGEWLQEALASARPPVVIDLRAEAAFGKGHIPGSVHVALQHLPDEIAGVAQSGRRVVCACNGSVQSAMAVVFLRTAGYEAFNLSGGISSWERQGRPLKPSDSPP